MSDGRQRGSSASRRRQGMQRVVVALPSGFTLGNLFCGIYAIIQASRNEFASASTFIVIGGILDALDGRVARATGTGSRFGEELDSLVDAISFGLAPALIMYFAVFDKANWDWLLVFLYTAGAVSRLARFNVEQAGRSKTHFHGLPSPAAGLTLASYYWFSTTGLYNDAALLFTDAKTLAMWPWHNIMRYLMGGLAFLMVTDIPYPNVPAIGFRTFRQIIGTLVVAGGIAGVVFRHEAFLFPACVGYVIYGLGTAVFSGLAGKRRTTPTDVYWEDEPDGEPAIRMPTVVPMQKPSTPAERAARREQREERQDRQDRQERSRRGRGRGERTDRPDRPDRTEKPDRLVSRLDRPDRPDRPREPRADGVLEEDPGMTSDLSRESREREARRRRRRGRRHREGGRPRDGEGGASGSSPTSPPSAPPPPPPPSSPPTSE